MTREAVQQILLNLLNAQGRESKEVLKAKDMKMDLNMDSIDDVSFLISAEQACGVRLEDKDLATLIHGSLSAMVDHICGKLSEKKK